MQGLVNRFTALATTPSTKRLDSDTAQAEVRYDALPARRNARRLPGEPDVPTQIDATDAVPDNDPPGRVSPDRDERRIQALKRFFTRASQGDGRIELPALRKLGAALLGETPPKS